MPYMCCGDHRYCACGSACKCRCANCMCNPNVPYATEPSKS